MDTIRQDVRYALRTLAKRPGFTVVTVLTLALGIGATTVIFGLVNGVLLESLPYDDPERLLAVFDHQPGYGNAPASYPEYLDWRQHGEVFEQVAAYFLRRVNLSGGGEPARLDAVRMSANLLPTLGVHPLLGRGFTADDEPLGAEPDPPRRRRPRLLHAGAPGVARRPDCRFALRMSHSQPGPGRFGAS